MRLDAKIALITAAVQEVRKLGSECPLILFYFPSCIPFLGSSYLPKSLDFNDQLFTDGKVQVIHVGTCVYISTHTYEICFKFSLSSILHYPHCSFLLEDLICN